jgi:hypothetical protein
MRDYREYDLSDVIAAFLGGFIIGFILALIFNAIMNINHTSNTDLLCGIVSDNNISNSTVITLCKERK